MGRAPVLDPDLRRTVLADVGGDPLAKRLVGFLRLLGRGGDPGANGPNRLVGNDHLSFSQNCHKLLLFSQPPSFSQLYMLDLKKVTLRFGQTSTQLWPSQDPKSF